MPAKASRSCCYDMAPGLPAGASQPRGGHGAGCERCLSSGLRDTVTLCRSSRKSRCLRCGLATQIVLPRCSELHRRERGIVVGRPLSSRPDMFLSSIGRQRQSRGFCEPLLPARPLVRSFPPSGPNSKCTIASLRAPRQLLSWRLRIPLGFADPFSTTKWADSIALPTREFAISGSWQCSRIVDCDDKCGVPRRGRPRPQTSHAWRRAHVQDPAVLCRRTKGSRCPPSSPGSQVPYEVQMRWYASTDTTSLPPRCPQAPASAGAVVGDSKCVRKRNLYEQFE